MLFLNFAIYKASASFSQNKFSQLVSAIDHFQKKFRLAFTYFAVNPAFDMK